MPSYLVPASQSFVPTQMYTPPIQAIGDILRIKQGRYDQGYNAVNSLRNSVFNSEVLSADGNAKKKQYIEQAEKALVELSQKDLSLPENVKAGEDIFRPFYEDQDLVREIGMVKGARKEISWGESLRTSSDEKMRAEYNPFSIKDLNNQLKEIAESDAEQRKSMSPRQYVKKVDIAKEMDEQLTKLGIKNASVIESVDGSGYKIINQFGKQSVLPLSDFFNASLSTDARAYVQMMGRLQYRDMYESKLEMTNGDSKAAKAMIADELINSDINLLEKTYIPELNKAKEDAESKLAALIAQRKAEGSDLSADDMQTIEQYKTAIAGYSNRTQEYNKNLANLKDKSSDYYNNQFNNYSTQGNNVFSKQITAQYANAWARSRANVMGSIGVDADKTWKNQQDLMMDAAQLKSRQDIAELNNQTKEDIAQMKAAKSGSKSVNGAGQSIGIVPGGRSNQVQLLSKSEQFTGAAINLSKQMVLPNLQLFEKTLADKYGINSSITGKIHQALMEGKGNQNLFTSEDVKNKTENYVAFKKLVDNGALSGMKPGEAFSWTYDQAFKILQNANQNFIKSDEGKAVASSIASNELAVIDGFGDLYAAVKEDQKRINTEILNKDKYKGYTITENGGTRLMTPGDIKKDTKIVLQESVGGTATSMFGAAYSNKNPKTITVDLAKLNPEDISADDNFASSPVMQVRLNGKIYTAIGNNPKEVRNNLVNNALDVFRAHGVDDAMEVYKKNDLAKLRSAQKDFEAEFEKIAPSLKYNLNGNADAFNFNSLEYRFGDKDNPAEPGEQAAASLLSPENIDDRKTRFLGVDKEDLEDDSEFMTLIRKVSAYLPELSGKNEVVGLRVETYNSETGTPAYKLKLSENQLMDALGVSKSDITPEMRKAMNKFQSDGFRMVAPNSDPMPGGLVNGLTPFESFVRSNGYKTGKVFDDLNIGNFELKKMTGGGYRVKANVYIYNPTTKQNELTPFQNGEDIVLPDDADVVGAISNMYSMLRRINAQSRASMQANPPVPKGTGTSVAKVEEELRRNNLIK